MKDGAASTWGYVFTVLSAGSGLLAVVSIPVAGTGAPLVVGSLSLVLAVVAARFSERVSRGRFTSLGAFLAVAIAAVAILLLFALGRVAWSQGPSESWIRVVSEPPYRYLAWTTLGLWLVGSWAVLCVTIVAASGVMAGRLCRALSH
jgi:hypothetical protein